MDVDTPAVLSPGAGHAEAAHVPSSVAQVSLKSGDPFDLEAYIAPYADRRRILRLLFIARSCPDLRVQAYKLALVAIKDTTLDHKLYLEIVNESKVVQADQAWVKDAKRSQESGYDKLDVELKNYQNNLIKESIRMGYRDIGDFQRKFGDLTGAVRSYTKSKDYCTTSNHIFDMCMNVIDTALDQTQYATIRNYVIKAESALGSIAGPSKSAGDAASGAARGVNLPGMLASTAPGKKEEEARSKHYTLMGEKLAVANAIAQLGQKDYEAAARGFLNTSAPSPQTSGGASSSREHASTSTSHFIPPADIGLYGVLCGMASFSRAQFKRMVVDNANLRGFLEHTPFLKDLIQQYYSSRFQPALQVLEENMSRLLLDIHLAEHVGTLLGKIKDRMVELYFEPFRSVKMDRMAAAFGWDVRKLEDIVVRLIRGGSMKARIDKRAQTIVAQNVDARSELYEKAVKVAADDARSTQMLTYRMRLIQNEIIVDSRKDSTNRNAKQSQGLNQQGRQQQATKRTDAQENAQAAPSAQTEAEVVQLINAD